MLHLFAILIFASAALTIWAKKTSRKKLEYIFKTLTMIFIIASAVLNDANSFSNYKILILGGLLFSLIGDVLLIEKSRFIYGLGSFFVAHLFYIAAFLPNVSNVNLVWLPVFAIYAVILLSLIWSGLGKLKFPVIFYSLVIAAMGFCAVQSYFQAPTFSTFYAMLGALLFMASDSILAFDKFKYPLKFAGFWILSTYFSAQWLIALSV